MKSKTTSTIASTLSRAVQVLQTHQIVQLRGPGFTPQLSERRSVLRPLEKPATGLCNCVGPDSLLDCQRDEALIAFWRSLRLECKQKGEKKKVRKKNCGTEFTLE
jgi:hypothetical protein